MGTTPQLGSIIIGSRDPGRLRAWYRAALGAQENDIGFFDLGSLSVLIDGRDDVADANPDPSRMIFNFHVTDARATAAHLRDLGVTWVAELEERPQGLFGTFTDPDGNYIQIIEFSDAYFASRGT